MAEQQTEAISNQNKRPRERSKKHGAARKDKPAPTGQQPRAEPNWQQMFDGVSEAMTRFVAGHQNRAFTDITGYELLGYLEGKGAKPRVIAAGGGGSS